jgi:hypothetical protein
VDDAGTRAFAAARAMVGLPFRPQGSDPATGLDCAGLVWAAYAAAGRRLVRRVGYPLRGWPRERIEAGLVEAGFCVGVDAARVGDVALIVHPARQYHLGLLGSETVIHAHAGLRRVVETPIDAAARAAARWRLS